jgi:hypothetical protein
MLSTLDGSDASRTRLSAQGLDEGHLGTGFGEVVTLLAAYRLVHANLQTLSQTLADQIEAMGIAIDISARGYQNVDEAQQAALWRIQQQTDLRFRGQAGGGTPAVTGTAADPGPGVPAAQSGDAQYD